MCPFVGPLPIRRGQSANTTSIEQAQEPTRCSSLLPTLTNVSHHGKLQHSETRGQHHGPVQAWDYRIRMVGDQNLVSPPPTTFAACALTLPNQVPIPALSWLAQSLDLGRLGQYIARQALGCSVQMLEAKIQLNAGLAAQAPAKFDPILRICFLFTVATSDVFCSWARWDGVWLGIESSRGADSDGGVGGRKS